MSLADLPDVLIAHLCSYLEYPDICKLMETSKKNYNAIKGYKKDKLNVDYLSLEISLTGESAIGDYSNRQNKVAFKGKVRSNGEAKADNIQRIIDECASIGHVRCDTINDNFCKAVIHSKTRIGSISNIKGTVSASPEQFILLCKKIKSVYMNYPNMNKALFTDEVFIKCLPSMNLEFKTDDSHISLELTDRTLEDLAKKDCRFLELNGVTTFFTVQGFIKALQVMNEHGMRNINWYLGVLLSAQLQDADRYFNTDTGEFRNEYRIDVDHDDDLHRTDYTLLSYNEGHVVYFSVQHR